MQIACSRKFISATMLAIATLLPNAACADQYVRGYTKKDGTVVNGYYRTDPDGDFSNNYSSYPNINPYTGKRGTKRLKGSRRDGDRSDFGNGNLASGILGDKYWNKSYKDCLERPDKIIYDDKMCVM